MPLIPDIAVFQRKLAILPLVTYQAGETVLRAASTSGQLLILKEGKVAVVKEGVEIARVTEPDAVFGELSVLLDQPHTADVLALEASQFVRQRHGYNQRRPPPANADHPWIGLGCLRSQQIRARPIDEQPAQITVAALGDAARGTKPSQAANSRPERNTFGSATVVAMAVAMMGPMPGMLASR